jgi:hypothetical protein
MSLAILGFTLGVEIGLFILASVGSIQGPPRTLKKWWANA